MTYHVVVLPTLNSRTVYNSNISDINNGHFLVIAVMLKVFDC